MTETTPTTAFFRPTPAPFSVRLAKKLLPDSMLRYLRGRTEPVRPRITVVSFYTEGGYYEEKANELRARCDELGMRHDIQPIAFRTDASWSEICRAKVRFYRKMLLKHRASIMWVDVDTKLLRNVDNLAGRSYDIGVFMRGFRFLPQENFALYARRFHPGYLILNYTRETLELLYECKRVEQDTTGDFTDDYILEEAFRRTTARPRLLVLSPNDISRPQDPENPGAYFLHGDSGNVKEFKGKVLQHSPDILRPESQKAVILDLIREAARQGKRAQVCEYYHALLTRNPEDFGSYHKLLEISAKFNDPAVLEVNLERYRDNQDLFPYALRFRLLQALDKGEWEQADRLFSEIAQTGNEAVISFSRSRLFRASLDRRAEAQGVAAADRVQLFWWEQPYPGNLGDIVNPYIVEKATGIPPKWAGRGVGLCAIGSVIKYAKDGSHVWGSGTPNSRDALAAGATYHAVRGPLTRDLIIENGGICPEVYGDPAWLLPILYPRKSKPRHKTGLILHFTHEEMATPVATGVKRIDIRRLGYDEIEAFLDEMHDCERIISSSLHGVIIAQAYGIPACLATVTNSASQIHGDGIKFDDYYQSIGHDRAPDAVDLSQFLSIDHDSIAHDRFLLAKKPIDLPALLDAAPFTVTAQTRRDAQEWLANFTFS
ncbi:polysaccharide pyruvyl transferase family protein [Paracoccus laeviglucosivorans]|uniref:Polysaccharide pyruvyl transferase n=1 Tax=Paracoccus laeviglucosivorans TaxID=1197861 RepID=A0A521ECT0_9RHOB|nr:polysaccharide pyruvyl transferase family protein [Paracoccus laeviglucosivorans]SMO81736.1 Polysaccharide pyruvyl transferase [Paracoccus laeviglucosivorans]